MSTIHSVLEIEVKGAEAIEAANKGIHDFRTNLEYASFNQARYADAARNTIGGANYGSNWNSNYLMPKSSFVPMVGWGSGGSGGGGPGAPPGGSGGGSRGGSGGGPGGPGGFSADWLNNGRRFAGGMNTAMGYGGHLIGSTLGGVAGAVGSGLQWGADAGLGALSRVVNGTTNVFKKLSDITTKMVSPGSFFGNMANMFTVSGLIQTASSINSRAFFSNAVGTNPNDILRLRATYGRFGDVGTQLGALAEARAAPYSLGFATSGISQQQARDMTSERLLGRMTDVARRYARDPNWGANEMTLQATGLGEFFNVQDMLRLKNITDQEYESIKKFNEEMAESSKLLERENWQRFNMLRQAGMAKIETYFQNKVEPLLTPITNAIDSVFNKIKESGVEEDLEEVISRSVVLIDQFTKSMSTGNWDKFFDTLMTDAVDLGKFMGDAATKTWNFIHEWAEKTFPQATKDFDEFTHKAGAFFNDLWEMTPTMKELKFVVHETYQGFQKLNEWLFNTFGINLAPVSSTTAEGNVRGVGSEHRFDDIINRAAQEHSIDPRDLWALIKTESGFDPNALSSAGAFGLGQLIPSTFRAHSKRGQNIADPEANINAAADYFRDILDITKGDVPLAAAAYNTGEYDKYIRAGQIPPYAETQKHVERFKKYRTEIDEASNQSIFGRMADESREALRGKAEERRSGWDQGDYSHISKEERQRMSDQIKEELEQLKKKKGNATVPGPTSGYFPERTGTNMVRGIPQNAQIRLSISSPPSSDIAWNTMNMAGALWG